MIVENGGSRVTVLDEKTLEALHRIPLRAPLHDIPELSPDGRYAFFNTDNGWLTKFDIWKLQTVAEVRVGLQSINTAVSSDGRLVAVANYRPQTLVVLDNDLNLLKVLSATDQSGRQESRRLSVRTATARESFVVVLEGIREVWELSYNPTAPEIPMGVIHDFQYREGAFVPGFLNPIRTKLNITPGDSAFSENFDELAFAPSAQGKGGIVNLDARRQIAGWAFHASPHLSEGFAWTWQTHSVLAAPDLLHRFISVLDFGNGKEIKRIPLPTQPQFIRSHPESRHLWVASRPDSNHLAHVTVIDKATFEIDRTFGLNPDEALANIVFSRDGQQAYAISAGRGNRVVAYDTGTLNEIGCLMLSQPATARHSAAVVARQ